MKKIDLRSSTRNLNLNTIKSENYTKLTTIKYQYIYDKIVKIRKDKKFPMKDKYVLLEEICSSSECRNFLSLIQKCVM
jgi:hypothetical protein